MLPKFGHKSIFQYVSSLYKNAIIIIMLSRNFDFRVETTLHVRISVDTINAHVNITWDRKILPYRPIFQ